MVYGRRCSKQCWLALTMDVTSRFIVGLSWEARLPDEFDDPLLFFTAPGAC